MRLEALIRQPQNGRRGAEKRSIRHFCLQCSVPCMPVVDKAGTRECRKAGSRVGSETRKGLEAGAGGRFRSMMVRGVARWLPWSRRVRPELGLSDTIPARCQRFGSLTEDQKLNRGSFRTN